MKELLKGRSACGTDVATNKRGGDYTAKWKMFNNNPAGKNVGDCAVRAVSKALDLDWVTAYSVIADEGMKLADMPTSDAVWGSVLRRMGFMRYIIPNYCSNCYTIADFADDNDFGTYVVGTGSHAVTIEDGVIWDSWDSSKEIPLYFWSREAMR